MLSTKIVVQFEYRIRQRKILADFTIASFLSKKKSKSYVKTSGWRYI